MVNRKRLCSMNGNLLLFVCGDFSVLINDVDVGGFGSGSLGVV